MKNKVTIAGQSAGVCNAEDGDLAIVPDGDGFIVGMFNGDGRHVLFGDTEREAPYFSCATAKRYEMLPSAGRFIGQRFGSFEECRDALARHRRDIATPSAPKAPNRAGGAR